MKSVNKTKFYSGTLLLLAFLLSVFIIAFIYINKQKTDSQSNYKSTNPAIGSENENNIITSVDESNNKKVPIPQLIMSSGNSRPVKANTLLSFTCVAPKGYECGLNITNTSDNSLSEILEFKKIQDEMGMNSVGWYWNAKKGKWAIKATLIGTNKQTSSSSIKELEVIN